MVRDDTDAVGLAVPDEAVVLAIDIGATKLAVGLVNGNGKVIKQSRRPNPGHVGGALKSLLESATALFGHEEGLHARLVAVGIACGGPLDIESGMVLSPPNLPDWDRIAIVEIFRKEFGVPVFLENDATAGALATLRWDNPSELKNIVYVTVSSGIGCGVISQGVPLKGHTGNGSELGHIPLVLNGRQCPCGQQGCAEAYVSGISIGQRFQELHTVSNITAVEVADLASQGNEQALEHWHGSMLMLRRVLRAALELFNPGLLVVGGGVTEASDALFGPALDLASDGALLSYAPDDYPTVRRTSFGRSSGVTSAAAVAWSQVNAQETKRSTL